MRVCWASRRKNSFLLSPSVNPRLTLSLRVGARMTVGCHEEAGGVTVQMSGGLPPWRGQWRQRSMKFPSDRTLRGALPILTEDSRRGHAPGRLHKRERDA